MKILHTLKTGNINEIVLSDIKYLTYHKKANKQTSHEGWAIEGKFESKGHTYTLMFTVEEAREFQKWLGEMLPRFETEDIDQFIVDESHD